VVAVDRDHRPGKGPLVVIDADVATARLAHALGYRTVFVQRPGAPVQALVDDHSGYYTVDFASDAFAGFVEEVLRPLAPTAVISRSGDGARPAELANALLATAGSAVEVTERLAGAGPPGPPEERRAGTVERSHPTTAALLINHHPYAFFSRGGDYILPASDVLLHMVTRNQLYGGVAGLREHPLDHVAVCDPWDEESWLSVCEWTLRHHPISRVIAVHEDAVLPAAELRSRFGLPGMDHETAVRFRDKVRMKEAVRAAGAAPVPDFAALDSVDDLTKVDWSTGRKVVKSRWGLAAKDLYLVDTLDEARRVVAGLDLSGSHYEVEEFVRGQIYHCDSVVQDGRIRFSSIGRYLADPASYSPGGIFGTVLIEPGDLAGRMTALNARVLTALGLRDGTTHLELFHTGADELVFCEVAGRPPGGIIPPVIQWQYGFNIVEIQIRLDAGLGISLGDRAVRTAQGTCGFIAFYPGGGEHRGIGAERFADLGIVEHIASPSAGNGRGGVRHSTDFLDSYVVKAPDDDALIRRIARIQDEYRC
jgi:hypothetical protein